MYYDEILQWFYIMETNCFYTFINSYEYLEARKELWRLKKESGR